MIKSMTAYADAEAIVQDLAWSCELRSVNHRYCDISVKLPERLRFAEMDLRRMIGDRVKRGKIECCFSFKKIANARPLAVNYDLVAVLLEAAADIEGRMLQSRPFSALEVLAFPGVQQENEWDKQQLLQTLLELLTKALEDLLAARAREGAQIKDLLLERGRKMTHLVNAAQGRMPEVMQGLRQKFMLRIAELAREPEADRLEQELLLWAQKLDVSEELDRLALHINEVAHSLGQSEPVGRRLDFLMQEMNREANTLGSKSADREMTQISIELKVLIEQMREQVQNIE